MGAGQPKDQRIIDVLRSRDDVLTVIRLKDGRQLNVFNIAWGYDEGDEYAHLTTNISPVREGAAIDVCDTADIVAIVDPSTGRDLYRISGEGE